MMDTRRARRSRRLAAALPLALAAGAFGCVMPDHLSQLQKDVADLRQELSRMQADQESNRQALEALQGGTTRQPDDEISREEFADLDARVDQAMRNAEINDERVSDLARRIERLSSQLEEAQALRRVEMDSPGGLTQPDEGYGNLPRPAMPPAGGSAQDAMELYNTAYADFSKGNYELAISGFDEFYQRAPEDQLADNALYWIGECYYSRGDFGGAIQAFDRMLETFPEGDKAAAANLKKGLAYLEQNQVRQAIVQLQHVRRTYPGTDEARVARDKLSSLGAPL